MKLGYENAGHRWPKGTCIAPEEKEAVVYNPSDVVLDPRQDRMSMDFNSILRRRETLGRTMFQPSTMSSQLSALAWNHDRMHNLILATGPGTPASIIYADNLRNRARWSEQDGDEEEDEGDDEMRLTWTRMQLANFSRSDEDDDDDDDDEEDDDEENEDMDEDDFSAVQFLTRGRREAGAQTSRRAYEAMDDNASSDTDNDQDSNEEETFEVAMSEYVTRQSPTDGTTSQRVEQRQQGCSVAEVNQNSTQQHDAYYRRPQWKPDVRHRGCINTACWLTVPWRLASPTGMAASQNSNHAAAVVVDDEWGRPAQQECPTQLATSGDDRVVKLWDARYAMGTANPLPGGWDTYTPLSATQRPAGFQEGWKHHYRNNPQSMVAGIIIPLVTVSTGHRGNVFDVTPLPHQPGKLLTCAADGYLRMVDVQAQSSSVVIDPLVSSGEEHPFLLHSGLAFSQTLLNANTGLLCSDRGLHLFDLRLSPREQARHSLIADFAFDSNNGSIEMSLDSLSSSTCCKACAVWRPTDADTESHYVFAGGSSAIVELYDLRVDGSRRQMVESYKPRFIGGTGDVSVSGLDVSKDGKELLVSYESDQIYSFPIMGSCPASPTLNDIESLSSNSGTRRPVADAMAYGGHLNRFTFLKNARYAGPHDEYICTGSDSGHAWIMERGTGTIVSLMSADSSTCNGVVPHPSLPFFITYGIDSIARLWRGTTPVDPAVDDSPKGRATCMQTEKAEISPVSRSPKVVQTLCSNLKTPLGIMPDFIASRQEIATTGKFSAPNRRGMVDYDSPRIGNSYRSLPSILRSNRYECYRAAQTALSIPIDEHGLRPLSVRVSLCRLRQQAQRLGVSFSFQNRQPWNLRNVRDTHPADLVPDYPSDWIFLDERMTPCPLKLENFHLNWKDWSDYLLTRNDAGSKHLLKEFAEHEEQRYCLLDNPPAWLQSAIIDGKDDFSWPVRKSSKSNTSKESTSEADAATESTKRPNRKVSGDVDFTDAEKDDQDDTFEFVPFSESAARRSQRYLYETALLLKEGGNVAMKDGHLQTAARRYDKSIQYCSVAFMKYREGNGQLSHLKEGLCAEDGKRLDRVPIVWSPLLRVLITARLNMALLLLKPEFSSAADASAHAVEALRLLSPFTVRLGAVVVPDKVNEKEHRVVYEDESAETFKQARALQAKAFFRLGSAEMEQGDWSAAVDAFQASIRSSDKPDSLVSRRLHEAKTKRNSKKKRDRKRFEFAFEEMIHGSES